VFNISSQLYGWLLFAYPTEFRHEFGHQMIQLFRDCYRAEARNGSLLSFWLRTLLDLVLTAAKERAYSSRKDDVIMNRNPLALVGAIAIIIIAFLLLSYGRKNEVASILLFGYVLDALVTAGVVGNVIVFVLSKATKINPLRIAVWTFGIVHGLLLLIAIAIGATTPQFNLAGVVIGYIVSFAIWTGLHFALRTPNDDQRLNVEH
jgi:hypothetical protein